MHRGEIWWAEFDERRHVVLLSEDEPSGLLAMQVVDPADADISGLGVEVAVGSRKGCPSKARCAWSSSARASPLAPG
jgi:mRNA interferase MazF